MPDTAFDDREAEAVHALYEAAMQDIPIDSAKEILPDAYQIGSIVDEIIQSVKEEWPKKLENKILKPYLQIRDELSYANGCLFRGMRGI